MNKEECNKKYLYILSLLLENDDKKYIDIMRKIEKTKICDNIYNLEHIRLFDKYETKNDDNEYDKYNKNMKNLFFTGFMLDKEKEIIKYYIKTNRKNFIKHISDGLQQKNYLYYNFYLRPYYYLHNFWK